MIVPWNSPQTRPNSDRKRDAERRMIGASQDRNAAGETEHAADGQIELADDHRQAETKRNRTDRGELL